MSEIKFTNFKSEDGSGGPDLVGVTTFTSPYYFVPPSGTTAQRPSGEGLAPGTLRFNTDIGRLEVWRGDHWATILGESPNLNGGARGLFGGGAIAPTSPNYANSIDYITISTLGNSTSFGILSGTRGFTSSCSSSTRGIWAGGANPILTNTIEFVTISSTGNSSTFGSLSATTYTLGGCSSSTRGLFGGGYNPTSTNLISYVTIASTGNSVTFGNLTRSGSANYGTTGTCASSTRGVWMGGGIPAGVNIIDYVTISTTGNAIDFGDALEARSLITGGSNSTRGVFGGGTFPANTNVIQFITIASTGNAQDFGDLAVARANSGGATSPTRMVFAGGYTPTKQSAIYYVQIATTGNSISFGDLSFAAYGNAGCSNGHGGL